MVTNLDPLSTRLSRRRLLELALGAGAAGALAGITGCATPTGLPDAGTLNLAFNRSLTSLDNKLNQFDSVVTVQRAVRQALTQLTPDLSVEPVLAESFRLTGDTEWTVRLRSDIRYSDKSPVRVEDVARALECYRETEAGFIATLFPEWPRVVKLDERTFRLQTDAPLPGLDFLMANILVTPAAANKPEELVEGIGTGPYVIDTADPGAGNYVLSANKNYWATRPTIDQVQVRYMSSESSRVVSLRSGEVDIIDSITPDSIEQLDGTPGVAIEITPGTRLTHLFYNFRKPKGHPLARAQVREALSYAVDGDALISEVLQDAVQPVPGVVPSTLTGAADVGSFRYDPAKAQELLRAQGVDDLSLTFIWESGEFAGDSQVMEAIYAMFRDVGVAVKLRQFEPGGDISTWREGRGGDWDVVANGYPGSTGLAITMLQGMFAGTAEAEQTRDTYHGYVVPEVAALIGQASVEIDAARRDRLLVDAQRATWNTWPAMWGFAPKAVVARRDRVSELTLGANNSYDVVPVRLAVE